MGSVLKKSPKKNERIPSTTVGASFENKIKKKPLKRLTEGKGKHASAIKVSSLKEKDTAVVSIVDNTETEKKINIPGPRNEMRVVRMSPFRFPLIQEHTIANVARICGVFFVAVGGLFSLLNISGATDGGVGLYSAQTAQISDYVNYEDTHASSVEEVSNRQNLNSTNSNDHINIEPDVRITVANTNTILSGEVPILITVSNADEVQIVIEDTIRNRLLPLGHASQIDSMTWKFVWETTEYYNGEYTIRAVIKNTYGIYEHLDSDTHEILNTSIQTILDLEQTQSTTSTTQISATSTEIQTRTIFFSPIEESPIEGNVTLKIIAHNSDEVKVYAKNTHTAVSYFVGYATHYDDDEWKVRWDSTRVPNGSYTLRARGDVNGIAYESALMRAVIENIDEQATHIETDTEQTESEEISIIDDEEQQFEPTISIRLSQAGPLNGTIGVDITTSPVEWVEVYAQSKNSGTPFFLGLAQKISVTQWRFDWETKQSPNGDYNVYVRVRTLYGFTESTRTQVRILNEILTTFTVSQEAYIDSLHDVSGALIQTTHEDSDHGSDVDDEKIRTDVAPEIVYVQSIENFVETVDIDVDTKNEIQKILREFKMKLADELIRLGKAKRNGDDEELSRIKKNIEDIKKQILSNLPPALEKENIVSEINTYISEITLELEELTIKNETILKERVGDAVLADSDKDSISDYDEINLYYTNPFSADTDGDGYIDGAEITLGYSPFDSTSEALVMYESPRETGMVREDLLVIESITTISKKMGETETVPAKALITGVGLPNSFVTLYIFSTPIVVTVKTDSDGSWSYILDKELEEGEHEIYIGVTDNAGRIVAKSNPLPFIKTAEAFTGKSNTSRLDEDNEVPSLINNGAMLLVASLAVVSLGLVLILLGIHTNNKKISVPTISEATV